MSKVISGQIKSVVYSEKSAQFVRDYEAKKLSVKSGGDWDDEHDPLLTEVKREIKKPEFIE